MVKMIQYSKASIENYVVRLTMHERGLYSHEVQYQTQFQNCIYTLTHVITSEKARIALLLHQANVL